MQDINNSSLEIELYPFDNNRFSSLCGKLDENINSEIRAIVFNCLENFGNYPIQEFRNSINKISSDSKLQLSKLGIRIGAKYFFVPKKLVNSTWN